VRRREFIALLGGAAVLPPLAAGSQQQAKIPRIAYLTPVGSRNPVEEAFEVYLQRLGWVRDRNIQIEFRYASERRETIATIIAEIASLRLDLVVVWSQAMAVPLMQADPQTAIVFLTVDVDPIEAGLVSNLARPGGRVTGITTASVEMVNKRLQLLKEVLPTLACAAVLLPTENRAEAAPPLQRLAAAARKLSINLVEVEVMAPSELEVAIRRAKDQGAEAVDVWSSGFGFSFAKQIADIANANGLPTIHPFREGAFSGCLLAYGADLKEQARRGAVYVDKILRGTEPGSLPVELNSKYELIVNLKTAKSLGLTVPPILLGRADQVIE
jgi:putative tryptophan/tyrosine transport system substrate-binding protein